MAVLFESSLPQKQPKYTTIFEDRMFTGIYTQRAALHDPSDIITSKYYGGRPDALWMGKNIELTNRLTLQRRPGTTQLSTTTYSTPPDRAFSFQLANGTIRLIIDTEDSGLLTVTSVANSIGSTAVYTGTFPGGASNGYVGLTFTIAGFATNPGNNGVYTCTASSLTTLTLTNAGAIAESASATADTAGGIYYDQQNGSKTLLLAKSPGAGQANFVAVAGVLYIGDGVDTKKYTPLNPNGTIWNWGIVAPTKQPNVTITPSGSAATVWQANTFFTTMGLTKDTNATPQIWQLVGVNADGTNTLGAQFGTAGTGEPTWPVIEGDTVVDGGVTWTNLGQILPIAPSTFYTDLGSAGAGGENYSRPGAGSAVSTIYGNFKNSGHLGNTGTTLPAFSGAYPGPSGGYFNNNTHWFAIGSFATPAAMKNMRWKPTNAYPNWSTPGQQDSVAGTPQFVLTGNLPATTATPIYIMVPTTGGTSGSGYAPFPPNAGIGFSVADGQLQWLCLGQAAWQANHAYVPWQAQGQTFGCIYDGTNFQVCIRTTGSGLSGPSMPTFGTGYGTTTEDGGVVWTCVGPNVPWVAGSATTGIWNLPTNGFAPPQTSQPYGSSEINAGGFVQAVIVSGKSGTVEPSFPAPPNTTSEGPSTPQLEWIAVSATTTNSLSWKFGLAYASSYKAMPVDDQYAPLPLGGGAIPPGGVAFPSNYPLGSETDAISTASPVNQIVGSNSGAVNTISGNYSPDPQVDTIVIWRSADSATGGDNMFELTEIPNIPALAGIVMWSFQDFLPSTATGTYPGLNILIPAPIDDSNDPPPSTFLPQVYNYQRIWGANGLQVNFSGGPDVLTGNPNEAFNPADEFPFLAPVVRLVKTAQGIATFLTDSIEMIGGGPSTASFFSVTQVPGIGLLSFNALDVIAGEIYFFGTDNQFHVMTPSLNLSNFGFALGDQFANLPSSGISDTTWDPSDVYVAVHQNGVDNCIFVADGSTGWYRLNPHQIPGGSNGPEPIWSPFAAITNGCQMVQSVETQPGIKKLLIGGATPAQTIAYRDLTVFTDQGTSYDAFFVMGSITLCKSGEIALLKHLEFDFSGEGFTPTISYLLNEISGTFTPFVNDVQGLPQFDPPSIYGQTISPTSYSPNRYYFATNAALARCRHMQIKVDYGTNSTGSEVYTMSIFGRKVVE